MKRKSLRRISVATTCEADDAVAELLNRISGTPASIYRDAETGISTVSVYLQQKLLSPREVRAEISAGLTRIRSCGLNTGSGKIVIAPMRHEDWAESWKRHFPPIEIGNALLIKPSWNARRPHKGQTMIVLDPGLSFGTGQHPTTAFCLREIVRSADGSSPSHPNRNPRTGRPRSFLDLGTGSGILAIAAAKLGYAPVRAFDSDPEAIRVARANARVNRVSQKLKILYGDVTTLPGCPGQSGQEYDLVCANLTAELLITARRRIATQLNRSGTLVLAGILASEFDQVRKAYAGLGLRLVSGQSVKEWRSGSFCFQGQNL